MEAEAINGVDSVGELARRGGSRDKNECRMPGSDARVGSRVKRVDRLDSMICSEEDGIVQC